MAKILDTLRQQHQKILSMLDRPEQVRELLGFVEKEHHPLEEIELFPFMRDQKCLRQGGPRCTYFMGLRLDNNHLDTVRRHLKELYLKTSNRPPAYPLPEWLAAQSPLSIPYEEHVVGADLAHCILFLLDDADVGLRDEFFTTLYEDYCRLLRLHIDKEDNCLFIICEQALA